MTKHLTREQVDRYRAGTLPFVEEDAVEEHLGACGGCRDELQAVARRTNASPIGELVLSPSEVTALAACPDKALLRRYVEDTADAVDQEIIEAHIANCSQCARNLDSLKAPASRPMSSPRRWQRWLRPLVTYGVAATIFLAGVAVLLDLSAPASWSRGKTPEQRKTLTEQLAQQLGEVLASARPVLEASRTYFRRDPERYGVFSSGPPSQKNWRARAELLVTQLSQTPPQFDRLSYGDEAGDFTFVRRAGPGAGMQVEHRWVIEDRRSGAKTGWRVYPVIGRAGEYTIDWSRERTVYGTFDPRKRDWYQKSRKSRSFEWTDHPFVTPPRPGVTASLPIIKDGKVTGVFALGLKLSDLNNYVKELQVLSDATKVFIISDEGEKSRVIVQTKGSPEFINSSKPEDELPLAQESNDPVLREIIARPELHSAPGSGEQASVLKFNTKDYYVVAQRSGVKNPPWTVIVAVPKQDIQRGSSPVCDMVTQGAYIFGPLALLFFILRRAHQP